jgi:hypothetical protein
MDSTEASQTIERVQELRLRTRGSLVSFWFPLLVFGSLTLGSLLVIAFANGPLIGVYWLVGGTLGGIATARHYRRRERAIGLESEPAPYVAVGLAVIVGCLLSGAIAGALEADRAAALVPSFVIAAGYAAFAWLDRSIRLAAIAALLGVFALGVAATSLSAARTAFVLALGYGAVGVCTGLALRAAERPRV